MTLTRRQFLYTSSAAAMQPAAGRLPNIVFILLDDAGWGDLGCYGQKLIRTPHIDQVAREGTRYTDCYAGGAVCAPSRSVLMTGLHTGHTAIRANAGTIPLLASDVTIAQVLKKAGYATGGFGKWGLGDAGSDGIPTKHGFDEFFGYLHQVHAHSYYPDFLWDNEKKFPLRGNKDGKGTQYSASVIADRSLEYLHKNAGRPFFLYACTTLPHAKFEPPDFSQYEKMPWTDGQKAYAAMVTRADAYVGRIMSALRDHGLEKDTLVFIASDNGAHSGEDKGYELFKSNGILRGEKGQLYEGGIRDPMIVRWPGRVKAGAVSDYPWYFCDMMPTLAELTNTIPPPNLDGTSVLRLLLNGAKPAREFLYWEANVWNGKTQKFQPERLAQAVRSGDWKAVRTKQGAPLELYNLRTDPGESKDVAAANQAVVAKIENYLKTARTEPRPHDTGSMQWVK